MLQGCAAKYLHARLACGLRAKGALCDPSLQHCLFDLSHTLTLNTNKNNVDKYKHMSQSRYFIWKIALILKMNPSFLFLFERLLVQVDKDGLQLAH